MMFLTRPPSLIPWISVVICYRLIFISCLLDIASFGPLLSEFFAESPPDPLCSFPKLLPGWYSLHFHNHSMLFLKYSVSSAVIQGIAMISLDNKCSNSILPSIMLNRAQQKETIMADNSDKNKKGQLTCRRWEMKNSSLVSLTNPP